MATIPNKVERFSDLEMDAFTTIAQANFQKAAGILEYINKCFPVGMLLYFYGSQSALPAQPDTRYWKLCDGTAVSNANSVFNGVTLPDLRGKFFKHPATGDTYPAIGGSNSVNLAHNHTGFTEYNSDYGSLDMDDGGERGAAFGNHRHTISSSMGSVSTIPAYREAQVYMRII